jgi:flagellar hook-associated protein 3 FlgL
MRVTANMSADNSVYNIQQGRKRLDRLQELITSQQNINRPSDDPISSRLLLDIGDKMKAFDQYNANIVKTKSWMEFNNTALSGMNEIMQQTKSLMNTINSGSTDPNERQTVHNQLVELKKQIIDMANTQYGDQYVFGGANNLVPPFQQKSGDLTSGATNIANIEVTGLSTGMQIYGNGIPANTTISAITTGPPSSITLSNPATATATAGTLNVYAGDGTERVVEIAANTNQTISVTGDRLLLGIGANPSYGSTNVLQMFDNLIAAVGDATTPSTPANITTAVQSLDPASKQIFNAVNTNLSRMIRVDNMTKLNENNKNTLATIAGNIQNVDMVKLGVQLNSEQNAFEASLAATAKLSQLSLLDYM